MITKKFDSAKLVELAFYNSVKFLMFCYQGIKYQNYQGAAHWTSDHAEKMGINCGLLIGVKRLGGNQPFQKKLNICKDRILNVWWCLLISQNCKQKSWDDLTFNNIWEKLFLLAIWFQNLLSFDYTV